MESKKKIIVYGAGDFGRLVKDLVLQLGHEFAGFIDDNLSGEGILGPYEKARGEYNKNEYDVVLAVGYRNLRERWRIFLKLKKDGYQLAPVIHLASYVRSAERIGAGSILMANSVIDYNAQIQQAVVVWPGAVVNHDTSIGNNSFLSPNCTVCGFVSMGDSCFVGAGAVITDHVQVPAETFIKAGCVYSESKDGRRLI